MKSPKLAGKIFRAAFVGAALLYGVNSLLIFSMGVHQPAASPEIASDGESAETSHIGLERLTLGGVLTITSSGYVNFAEAEPKVYVKQAHIDAAPTPEALRQFYIHEELHLKQKELVAEAAGGYPSHSNPLQSARYFFNLFRLESDLRSLMPELREAGLSPFGGLEASADCYSVPRTGTELAPALFEPHYVKWDSCTAEAVEIADRLAAGEWPKRLSAAEASLLPELHLIEEEPLKGRGSKLSK